MAGRERDGNGRERGGVPGRGFGPGRGGSPPPGRIGAALVAPDPYRYTMADLEEQTGFDARTIRYYITRGLLASAHGRGPTATYDLGHLLRLQAIRLLKEQHRQLDEIRERLGALSDDDLAAMLEVETKPPEDRWRRVQLHPDIELHVRDRGSRDRGLDEAAELIVGYARPVIDRLEAERGRR